MKYVSIIFLALAGMAYCYGVLLYSAYHFYGLAAALSLPAVTFVLVVIIRECLHHIHTEVEADRRARLRDMYSSLSSKDHAALMNAVRARYNEDMKSPGTTREM